MRWSLRLRQWLILAPLTCVFTEAFAFRGAVPANQEGRKIFITVCSACHGLDGRGGERAPNIVTTPKIQLASDSEVLTVIQRGIPSQGMPGFKNTLDEARIDAVAKYLRELQGKDDSVPVNGSTTAGKELFFGKAKCAGCHSIHGKGGFFASDLSTFGTIHSTGEIRTSITAPNKDLDPRNETLTVLTARGESYTGFARNEDNFSLQLQTVDGKFHLFDKSELASVKRQRRSLMPDDYGSRLTPGELDDLVAYIRGLLR